MGWSGLAVSCLFHLLMGSLADKALYCMLLNQINISSLFCFQARWTHVSNVSQSIFSIFNISE